MLSQNKNKILEVDVMDLEKNNFEKHIPTYRYCGPGTKVVSNLENGVEAKNELDEACKIHDIEYFKYAGDEQGLRESDKRLKAKSDKIWGLAAWLVSKTFSLKGFLEDLKIINGKKFAANLGQGLTIDQQKDLGKMLYDKYILKKANVDMTRFIKN